ncbi:MAG: hypothetical protein U0228_19170 [Myxococcaceae bacterium]
MFSDSDHSPRFGRQARPMKNFRVDAVERDDDSGESAVRGRVKGKPVEVRYVETSGEFRMVSDDGSDVQELSRSDLRDLGPALDAFQKQVPWSDSEAGRMLRAVNDAIFPTALSEFRPRTVSELRDQKGNVVLLTGWTRREEIDLVLHTATGELSLIVTSHERKAPRRPLTSNEAWELMHVLAGLIEGQPVTTRRSLLALLLEAARRHSRH